MDDPEWGELFIRWRYFVPIKANTCHLDLFDVDHQ